ncbi:MAG TPA: alpha/beta hydrolase [Chthoniobacterales bacterium]|nr:alpha/beta hydrolase [Chthoniobacterales bacterium]
MSSTRWRRILKRVFVGAGALLVVLALSATLLRLVAQHRVAGRIRISSPGGVSSVEKVRLGALEQWIQIRGHDRTKPVLLFLHGGPGFPQMPFSHLNAELEKHFVVVQWDQRGAGKSYAWVIPDESMRVDQFVADTRELTLLLLQRFNAEKCYLVAHSWGSLVGALTVARHPELFHAYVGIGQVAGLPETQQVRYDFALGNAREENNTNAVVELTRIGRPPHSDFDGCKIMEKWVNHYAAEQHRSYPPTRFARLAFGSPAYSWVDLAKIPLGFRYSFSHLWREIFYETNLFEEVPRIEVPVYFFIGRYDWVVTADVAQRYFAELQAPRGKQLIWFEESAHWPHFAEPEKYRDMLVEKVLAETAPPQSPAP